MQRSHPFFSLAPLLMERYQRRSEGTVDIHQHLLVAKFINLPTQLLPHTQIHTYMHPQGTGVGRSLPRRRAPREAYEDRGASVPRCTSLNRYGWSPIFPRALAGLSWGFIFHEVASIMGGFDPWDRFSSANLRHPKVFWVGFWHIWPLVAFGLWLLCPMLYAPRDPAIPLWPQTTGDTVGPGLSLEKPTASCCYTTLRRIPLKCETTCGLKLKLQEHRTT